jgi:phospholipid/cholesterol/gamma-HCH transport system permease protein
VITGKSTSVSLILEGNTLKIMGILSFKTINKLLNDSISELLNYNGELLLINLDQLDYIDSAGVTTLFHLADRYEGKGIVVRIEGGNEDIRSKLDLFKPKKAGLTGPQIKTGFLERLGNNTSVFYNEYILGFLQISADITYWSLTDLFHKPMRRKGEFVNQAILIGVNSLLIVGAMSFIIGLVLALQSAAQLRSFGANIYIVDLIVIAMMCEMGPLITAIMVAGRSGSSIAAEISTMKVTSEIDALRTMGLNPIRFVVVPKMHGSIVTLPFLTIIADILGIAGGLVIAVTYLDISPVVFMHRMQKSLYIRDIIFGVIKSCVFGYIIVITGSFFGFRVEHGAEGVGKVTTTAVVVALTLVIIADSIMGLVFYS